MTINISIHSRYDERGKQLIKELVDKTNYNLTGLKGFHLDLQGYDFFW